MRSTRQLILVILNVSLYSKLFIVVVDALLSVDVGVTTVIFKKPPIDLVPSSRFTDSSLPRTSMVFASLSRPASSIHSSSSPSSFAGNDASTEKDANEKTKRKKRSMYSFFEARKIARGHGFDNQDEFVGYDCPGAYQLPKNADEVWSEDWTSWEDFLGVPLEFEEARDVARTRVGTSSVTEWKASTETEYKSLFERKEINDADIASRLPYQPDLKYKNTGWVSWEDFLRHDGE